MAGTVGRKRLELFLDLYKQIEDVLEEKYRNSRRHYTSAVYEFIKDYESAPVRDKLDICRHIRNLMAHSANMDGEPVVVPSQPVVDALQEVLDFVSRPPLALEYATKGERVLKVGLNQKVLRVMELMEKNGYSHVPVMKDGRFYGVFSVGAVFRYVLRRRGKGLDPEATIKDLKGYLAVEEHTENYEFVPADASYIAVRQRFELPRAKNKRVAVIFITQDGKPDQPLLGMLTPWDVLGEG
jgi:CBS domain-containing protein